MTQPAADIPRSLAPILVRVFLLALCLNMVAWVGATLGPDAQAWWTPVSLTCFFVLGLAIGRWWALLVTCAFAVIHAVPVYLKLLPGYLSTWGEALWWALGLTLLLALTVIGVLVRAGVRRLQRRS